MKKFHQLMSMGCLGVLLFLSACSGTSAPDNKVANSQPKLPPDNQLEKLAKDSMALIAEAVSTGETNKLYDKMAVLFQKGEESKDLLKKTVQVLKNSEIPIDKQYDIKLFTGIKPVFDVAPSIRQKNILQLNGYFPIDKVILTFEFQYVYEHPEWKLGGFWVQRKAIDQLEVINQ